MPSTLPLRITAIATLLTVALSLGCTPHDIESANKRLEIQRIIDKSKKQKQAEARTEPITITGRYCSMVVPPNWAKSDMGSRGGIGVHKVNLPIENLDSRVSMCGYAVGPEKLKSMQESNKKIRTLESRTRIKIGGLDAEKLISSESSSTEKGSRYVTVWVPLKGAKETFRFEAQGSPEAVNAAMSDIDSMLKSVEFHYLPKF